MIAEQFVGPVEIAVLEQLTDAGRRDRPRPLFHEFQRFDHKSVAFRCVAQKFRRAAPLTAKMEVLANDHPRHVERVDQEALHKVLGLDLRELAVERHHHNPVEPQRLGQLRLGVGFSEPEHHRFGRQHITRVRFEGQDDRRHAALGGAGLQGREDMLVTPVHTVEIADGHGAALERCWHVVEAG